MPKIKNKPDNQTLVTTGLAALYSAHISHVNTDSSNYELTEAVKEFLEGGAGVEANIQTFIDDCKKLSLFFYRLLGSHWLDGITCTEQHVFNIAWAANVLTHCVEHGDWTDFPREMIDPCILAASRCMDLGEVMWAVEDFALPHSTDAREIRDSYAKAVSVMEKERKDHEARLAAAAVAAAN